MAKDYLFHHRNSPILISVPHDGAVIPEHIGNNMHNFALKTPDRDFFVTQLFSFAKDFDISLLKTNISRYVIDMNRPSDDTSLYPGQAVTELCPTSSFDNRDIYKNTLTSEDIKQRITTYWQPYHQIIADKLQVLKAQHGFAILIDAHSIKSHVPRFFLGQLPDINIGTNSGHSCSQEIENKFNIVLNSQRQYSFVFNARFKGGYITREYGKPAEHIHAIQIEISQVNYLDESNNRFQVEKAEKLKTLLIRLVNSLC
ncbi:N-formylglutamate deformylase [hydrothermal vent metagenome]|uniref:N-formylglutamate deformylase n=1 Tax=hydrothermal vent metagenome TaxID=652676 RepID=A0A3B0W2R5_9ZZZZ